MSYVNGDEPNNERPTTSQVEKQQRETRFRLHSTHLYCIVPGDDVLAATTTRQDKTRQQQWIYTLRREKERESDDDKPATLTSCPSIVASKRAYHDEQQLAEGRRTGDLLSLPLTPFYCTATCTGKDRDRDRDRESPPERKRGRSTDERDSHAMARFD